MENIQMSNTHAKLHTCADIKATKQCMQLSVVDTKYATKDPLEYSNVIRIARTEANGINMYSID